MLCLSCGCYFKKSAYNKTSYCEYCSDASPVELDSEAEVEVNLLVNPTGRVQAFIQEDKHYLFSDDEGFGY